MEQTVAERTLSKEQQVDHRQTCNNGSMRDDILLRQDPSESWHPRSRTCWSSFQGDNLVPNKPVCRDFLRSKCARGTTCRFKHCESDGQDGPSMHNLDSVANSGKSQFYGENMFHDSRTRYFHREHRSRSPCRKFQNGMCHRGESCRYLHSEYTTHDRIWNGSGTELHQRVASTSRNPGFGEGNIGNSLWTSQEHEEANEGKDISTRFFSRGHRSKSPCRNFLRGRCYREVCPYYHPGTYPRPRNEGTSQWRPGLEANSENPSFGEGVDITSRTSEEYKEANEGNDQSTRSLSTGNRSRSYCRDFLRGSCYRECCPYLHLDTYVRSRDNCSTREHQEVAVTSEKPGFGEGSVDITSKASKEQEEANEGSDRIARSFSAGCRSKSPCRNFLRGRCHNGADCSYLHLDAHDIPRNDCNTQQGHGDATTSEKPDFGEGSKVITLRTSQEQEEASKDENLRCSYLPRGPRSRSPCRKFLSGRCYRGASCRYLHLDTYDRSRYSTDDIVGCERNGAQSNLDVTSRSWSPDRKRSRPLGDLGSDKPRPEVCLKYCRGRCTLGESCKYLHSFHEYAKSASDWSKVPRFESAAARRSTSGMHQRDPPMMLEELDGSFVEKTKAQYSDTTGKPNIPDEKDAVAVEDQQKCEISGEEIARNCDFSEADENINLCHRPFKRRRSRSRSPFSPEDDFVGRKMRRDESKNQFHRQGSRSRSPLTQVDDRGCRQIRRDESHSTYPRGRYYNVAPFRYPYSHSYQYNRPRYYMNYELASKVAAVAANLSSHEVGQGPNMMETQGHDEVMSREMRLDQCPSSILDSGAAIVNEKNEAESVKDAEQPSHVVQAGCGLVRDCGELDITKGENAIDSVAVESDFSCSCGEFNSSPMDTNVCASNKDDNAETDMSQENVKPDQRKQPLITYDSKMERKSCSKCCNEPLKGEVSDPSTCGLPGSSAGEVSLSPDSSVARVSEGPQDVVTIHHLVQRLELGNRVVTNKIENNVASIQATSKDGTSVGYSKSNTVRPSQSPLKAASSSSGRKLLVLDVNGLLADIVAIGEVPRAYKPDMIIAMKAVFKRPFCDDFLEFCFERFDVGVWSSRNKKNVDRVVDLLMYNTKKKLLFCWDQAHCTETGYKTIENRDKPLVLKELKKLWEKEETDLPWDKGFYNETNTVLLDDSPYKALRNPPYTAIFPYAYKFRDAKDRSLGPGGDLRVYLERLAAADNVQKFIQENPFGQRPITKSNLSWGFYSKIVGANENKQEGNPYSAPAMKVVGVSASEQETDAGNSPACKSAEAHAGQQNGNADARATKSAGDHAEQQEGNADKTPAANPVGALANQQGNADNDPSTEGIGVHPNEQYRRAGITCATKDFRAYVDQQDGNADYILATESVAIYANRREGNADNITDTKVVAHANRQEGNAGNITDSKVEAHANQQERNADNTTNSEVVPHANQQNRNAGSTHATTRSDGALENQPNETVDISPESNIVGADADQLVENTDNAAATKVEANGSPQERNCDETPDTS